MTEKIPMPDGEVLTVGPSEVERLRARVKALEFDRTQLGMLQRRVHEAETRYGKAESHVLELEDEVFRLRGIVRAALDYAVAWRDETMEALAQAALKEQEATSPPASPEPKQKGQA
jgi:hypothetical protein